MLEGQFYLRLLLIAIMGITFVFTMAHLGKRNPKEESNEKHFYTRKESVEKDKIEYKSFIKQTLEKYFY